jgi:uncharacterized membrane protein
MTEVNSTVAVFKNHGAAETAIKKLAQAGFDINKLSVIGKGYHSDEKVVGFYNVGDRIKFWGRNGVYWGGLWGLFLGGMFVSVPVVGQVVVLGYLATVAVAAIESAIVVGGVSALSAALYSIGIPKDSVLEYEAAIKADEFLVVAHGTEEEAIRAKAILATVDGDRIEIHSGSDRKKEASLVAEASA